MKKNNSLNLGDQINKKFIKTLITIILTLPFALLICILSFSIIGDPNSLRDIISFTPIIAFFLFWIILLIVNKFFLLSSPLKVKNPEEPVQKRSILFVLIPFLLFISLFTWILLTVEDLQGIQYFSPNYKYQLKIYPASNNSGEICIDQIINNKGIIYIHNNAIQEMQISGDWQQDTNDCLFYLESGDQGDIDIDYVGAIDDTLRLDIKVGPGGGIVNISSNPGQKIEYNLSSEKDSLNYFRFQLGTHLIRNIADWGILAGLVSVTIIFLMIIYMMEKRWMERDNIKQFSSRTVIKDSSKFLSQSISERSVILILLGIYIIGVLLTLLITRPLAFGPSHFGDEIIYWETAVALYDGSFPPSQFRIAPPFYPLSLLPAFFLFSPENAFLGAKILNALYFTSAIFPAYFLLRMFLNQKKSILITSLFLINPAQIIFPPRILSENLFFPLLLWAILLGFKTYDQPDKRKPWISFIFGLLLSLLYLTRYIGLAIIPALLIIWWLKPENNTSLQFLSQFKNKIKPFFWVLVPIVVILGAWMLSGMMEGSSPIASIGISASAKPKPGQTFYRLIMWGSFYASYTILMAAPFLPIFLSSFMDFKKLDAERKRWLIALIFIVFFVVAVCIRHSWRAHYNFPEPLKLQGRYIFFLNHLFLLTSAILFFREPDFFKRVKSFAFSCFLVALAYAIKQIGFIFLNYPIKASVSSPYGRFMDAYGSGFLTFSLIFILLFTLLPFLKKSVSKSIVFLYILGFYILGGTKVFMVEKANYSQIYNSQIYYLINEGIRQCENYSKESEEIFKIYYHEDIEVWVLRYWRSTLDFYGLTNAEFIPEKGFEISQISTFRAEYGTCKIKLRYLYEEDFQTSSNPKFSYRGEYFDYQKEN